MDTHTSASTKRASRFGWPSAGKTALASFGRTIVVFESWFFSFMFLLFAAATVTHFFQPLEESVLGQDTPFGVGTLLPALVRTPGSIAPDTSALHALVLFGTTVVRPLMLLFFDIMCATFILLRGRIRYQPTVLREIVIPLLGTFIMMLLPLSAHVGGFGRPFTFPDGWMVPLLAVGTILGLAGGAFAVYALMYLRQNFSIFVEVRDVVLDGPYRYVRHPMYLGEIVMIAGLVLAALSPFSIGLLVCLVSFQWARARMEQSRLSEASPEYAAHMQISGMFFPRADRDDRSRQRDVD